MMNSFDFFLLHTIFLLLCISLQKGLAKAVILGNETDKLALHAFKNQIYHDPLHVLSSWNDSVHFCKWEAVTCGRRHGRVLMLNLKSQGLGGYLSPYIGNLSFLRKINLDNNSFEGEIPQEVGRLFRLQEFNTSNNSFSGEIPVNLTNCFNLKSLRLGYNKFIGKIPIELGSLSKLILLHLLFNNLTGGIPPSLGNLSSLNSFSISFNSLEGSVPDSLGQLKSLEFLGVTSNMLSGMFPPSLYNTSSLEKISISGNQLKGSLPLEIGVTLPNLVDFYIGGNQFSGSIPVSLFNVSQLEELDISENNFHGEIPINVGDLKVLQFLNLELNHLGNDLNFFNSLTNCTSLKVLAIDFNHFSGVLPNSIANLSILIEELYLGSNQIFGNIPSGIENLINLFTLGMEENFFTGSIPLGIGKLQKLQVLFLSNNRFSGHIPSSVANLSFLFHLDLSNNTLEGNIVSDIGNCQSLKIMDLSNNNLNGIIPIQVIGVSSKLTSINLAHNSLTGSLPLELGTLESLEELDISENKMSGKIPNMFGSSLSLEHLFLQGNFFEGPIPQSFSSLKAIQDLDLSRNNLSGKIPKDLEDLSFFQNLNMSFNDLEGEVPIKGVFKNSSAFSIVGNSKLCGGIPELHLPTCSIMKSKKRRMHLAFKMIIGIILSSIVVAFFLALYWRKKKRTNSSPAIFLGDWFRRISYDELYRATGGFVTSNLIGMGKFGFVYKGVLPTNEMSIAVKVLNLDIRGASNSFMSECKALQKIRHRNLLKIITACSSVDFEGNDFKALIFEFMPNGSLEDWLHPRLHETHLLRNLNLSQRLSIAIDVASALDYLHNHCQEPIIHCDLKPSNILLDDDMTAHLGDFGLAKLLSSNIITSTEIETNSVAIRGSIGYVPPEYGIGAKVSTQGDVYSYGILLLEMFTEKRPTDNMFKDGLSLHHFSKMALTERVMEILDPCLFLEDRNVTINDFQNQGYCCIHRIREILISIVQIGVACSVEAPGERMNIKDVVMELHTIKKMLIAARIDRHGQNSHD